MKMRKIFINVVTILTIVLLSSICFADKEKYWPTEDELLDTPVVLSGCNGIKIIEWKQSSYSALTKESKSVYIKLNAKCKDAKSKFIKFAKSRYDFEITDELDETPVKISFLSANQHADGLINRQLNDPARFGKIKSGMQWGHVNYGLKYMLLRNDPLWKENNKIVDNKYFYRTFVHELSHLFAYYSKLRSNYLTTAEKDEEMAEAFTKYLGYSEEDESAIDTYVKVAD